MDDLVVPCAGVVRDNNIREDLPLQTIACGGMTIAAIWKVRAAAIDMHSD